jgi:capsular polysaccharide biosynthesis protein
VPRVRDYVRMLAHGWLVILCATALSTVAAVLADRYLQDPVYVAETRVFAVVPGDAQTRAAYEGNRGASVRMRTYAQMATSTIVTQRTIDELGLQQTPEELAARITVDSVPDTLSPFALPMSVLLRVQVSGSDPDDAVTTANEVTRNLIAASQEVEWNGADNQSGPNLVLIDQATSAHASGGSWLEAAGSGAALGLVLSCLAVLATGARRDAILNGGHLAHVADEANGGDES